MKTRYYYLSILLLSLIFVSCSSEDDDTNPGTDPGNTERMEVEIVASKTRLRLFEPTEIAITNSQQYWYYDSIVWSIPEIFKDVSGGNHFLHWFTQSFYLPGEYTASLAGYKDGKISSTDTVRITVQDNGDFLGLNWNDLTTYEPFNFLKYNTRNEIEYSIDMSINKEPVEYVKLKYQFGNNYSNEEEWKELHKNSKKKYYDYIVSFYGEPIFYYTNSDIRESDLIEEYNERFSIGLNEIDTYTEYVPVAIWETSATYICLIGSIKSGMETEINYFKVIAQPKIK